MKLDKVLKKATPGPVYTEELKLIAENGKLVAWVNEEPPEFGDIPAEEADANLCLLAHCRNKFEDLIKAFEAVMYWCDDSDDFEDEPCLVKARAAIIDANEVDGI